MRFVIQGLRFSLSFSHFPASFDEYSNSSYITVKGYHTLELCGAVEIWANFEKIYLHKWLSFHKCLTKLMLKKEN